MRFKRPHNFTHSAINHFVIFPPYDRIYCLPFLIVVLVFFSSLSVFFFHLFLMSFQNRYEWWEFYEVKSCQLYFLFLTVTAPRSIRHISCCFLWDFTIDNFQSFEIFLVFLLMCFSFISDSAFHSMTTSPRVIKRFSFYVFFSNFSFKFFLMSHLNLITHILIYAIYLLLLVFIRQRWI